VLGDGENTAEKAALLFYGVPLVVLAALGAVTRGVRAPVT
jgi:hypothetical protein